MTNIDREIEDLGTRAAMLELYASERDAPLWMRAQDAERAQALRERQYLLLAGMRKCVTEGCETLVGGSRLCPRCEEELHAHRCAALYNGLSRVTPEPSRAMFWTALAVPCGIFWMLCIWGCIELIKRLRW